MQTLEASLARIEGALLGARAGAGGTGGGSAASTSNGTAAGAGTSASAGAAAAAAAAAAASASHDDNNGANNGGGGFSNSSASDHVRLDGRHNPLDTVGEAIAIQALDTMQGDGTPAQDHHRHLHHDVGNLANDTADGVAGGGSGGANVDVDMDIPPDETESWAPDAVTRGFISLADCQALFDSFISNNGPWVFFLHPLVDAQAGVVRRRSPILFHTIILISLSYRPPNPANVSLYRAVSSLLDAILAPAIIAPQPEQLQTDFVRAMLLLLQFKPIQYNALALRGVRDPAVVEQRSRISVRSSFMMRGVILRASAFINLVSIAATFTRAFAQRDSLPIPVQVLIDLRTLYCQVRVAPRTRSPFLCHAHETKRSRRSGQMRMARSRVDASPRRSLARPSRARACSRRSTTSPRTLVWPQPSSSRPSRRPCSRARARTTTSQSSTPTSTSGPTTGAPGSRACTMTRSRTRP